MMSEQERPRYKFMSGAEAVTTDVPDVEFLIEEKLRPRAKGAIIGSWKAGKSFFAIQLGMSVAYGQDFLGFKTKRSNVLYINFEVSPEGFQQRIQDAHRLLGWDLSQFRYVTITELCLDLGTAEVNAMMEQCAEEHFDVEVLIIDPRWHAIKRDSNQDEVVRAFCVNLDKVIAKYNLAVIVVHHTGVATASDKAGKGSTVFEVWLDSWFRLKPYGGQEMSNMRELDIWSRDSERQSLIVEFDYPIFKVRPEIIAQRKAKTIEVKKLILKILTKQGGEKSEADVRFDVLAAGHSEYAFWRARKELVEQGQITVRKADGQGNRKCLKLVE